jgi:hypothetical protein
MARRERDREDLLAEATALVERVGLQVSGRPEAWVIGFRRDGSASFYFGADPVYQFTSDGKLRRAFVDGLIYKAEAGRLVSLDRQRTSGAVDLVRHDLDDREQRDFLEAIERRLCDLVNALNDEATQVVGQVPTDVNVKGRVKRWLARFDRTLGIADSPRSA